MSSMGARVDRCPRCDQPIAHAYDEATGSRVAIGVTQIPNGRFDLVGDDGLLRRRLTAAGRPRRGGKGYEHHTCTPDIAALAGIGQITPQEPMPAPESVIEPEEDALPPIVIIEAQELLGPQEGTGYIEWTGPLGRSTCGACGDPVLVCLHETRPDGTRPVILHDVQHTDGPWRAFMRQGEGPYASFASTKNQHANRYNHRLLCPGAHA